jgi:hypothetical protein
MKKRLDRIIELLEMIIGQSNPAGVTTYSQPPAPGTKPPPDDEEGDDGPG